MEIRQLIRPIWKWMWLIVLSTAVAGFVAWWFARDQPPIYQTSSTLMIGQLIEDPDLSYVDFYTGERLAQTYSELIKREPILKAAASALGFEEQWRSLRNKVGVNLVPGTELIEITVTDTDPSRAKAIADEVAVQLQVMVTPDETPERQFVREQAAAFPARIKAAQDEIGRLQAQVDGAFSAREIQDLQSQINSLQNQVNTWQSTFAQYQLLLGERSVKLLEVIEEAAVPTMPVGPNWMLQVMLAAAIGAALGVAAAFLLEYLDETMRSPDDVTKATGLTTLGAITRISGDRPDEKLITVLHPRSPISEAYRTMRTNLQFSALDRELTTLVVTSPSPKEGKSTTAANLSVVMAQAGKSVVLVDSDLRRPLIHKIFQLSNQEGLTNALLLGPTVNGQLQETGIENLRVLTSGPLPPNPSELLGSQKMEALIAQLKEEAEIIVFDTPPALPVTDAAVLSTKADGVLIVADAGKTGRGAAGQAVENLRQVGANLLGVAVNRLSPRGSGNYYYYYYYYHYRYAQDTARRRKARRRWYRRIPLLGALFRRETSSHPSPGDPPPRADESS
jgi:non-specific protein-tyrosine kinase